MIYDQEAHERGWTEGYEEGFSDASDRLSFSIRCDVDTPYGKGFQRGYTQGFDAGLGDYDD